MQLNAAYRENLRVWTSPSTCRANILLRQDYQLYITFDPTRAKAFYTVKIQKKVNHVFNIYYFNVKNNISVIMVGLKIKYFNFFNNLSKPISTTWVCHLNPTVKDQYVTIALIQVWKTPSYSASKMTLNDTHEAIWEYQIYEKCHFDPRSAP